VSEHFLVEREHVDAIPPTPQTSRRLTTCVTTTIENEEKTEVLLYSANGATSSPWIDADFDVTEKGDNNFQDNESRTLNIHYNRNTLAWKCVWDGDLYYRIGDFNVLWQKDQFNVSMNFINTVNLDDVSQGDVGDCWLLSSVITLANFGKGLLDYVICREENMKKPNGPYKFRFHKCGKWHTVTVDNVMPMCGTARSAYYSMVKQLFDQFYNKEQDREPTDFWVPLLEKAFAKFCGSYRTLIAGHPVRGLSYLTGGVCIRMNLTPETIAIFEANQGTTSFFNWLVDNLNKVMCCTSSKLRPDNVAESERTDSLGVAYNHAYSLLHAQVVHLKKDILKFKHERTVELLKIRNPWNKKGNKNYETEWQGDWSDNSKLWKLVEKSSLTELPVAQDNGEFWMAKDDWLKHFRVIDICFPPSYFNDNDFDKIELMDSAVKNVSCSVWTKGSHARHYTPSAEWPVTALIGLNENNGFTTHYFSLSSNPDEGNKHLFVQMMFDMNYRDRQTWLKTLLLFDITNNQYIAPYLGECHDLVTANDSVLYHIEEEDEQMDCNNNQICELSPIREFAIQFKLSPKADSNVDALDYIIRIYSKAKFNQSKS